MPLLEKQEAPLWGVWQLSESSDELLAMLSDSPDYASFMQRVGAEPRRQEWLASRVLLKELIGREVRVAYRPNGSPFLPDEPLAISISHTRGYVAVLVQQQAAAGIDIEYRSERIRKIASRFLTADEAAAIDRRYETEHLLLYWCAKETLFKLIGQEEVDFCRHLHVAPFEYAPCGVFTVGETRTPACLSYTLGYRVTPHFVVTWSLG